MADAAYIVAATRTAGGRKGGKLAGWHPIDLGAAVLNSVLDRTGVDPAAVDDVVMGCVGQVGEQSLNVARNAVLASRMPESVPGTSVDRQCGSSQQALQFAAQAVMSGTQDIVIASGVESMTRVPMGLSVALPAQAGMGNPKSPRMEDRYPNIQFSQFVGAEMVAAKYNLTKDQIDEFAYGSHPARHRGDARRRVQGRDHPDQDQGRRGRREPPHRRRGHPLRRLAGRHQGREAAARGRPDHRRHLQPDLRRRLGGDGGLREGAEGARPDPARPHPPRVGLRRRPGDHAGSPDPLDPEGAEEGRHGASTTSISSRSTRRSARCRWRGCR